MCSIAVEKLSEVVRGVDANGAIFQFGEIVGPGRGLVSLRRRETGRRTYVAWSLMYLSSMRTIANVSTRHLRNKAERAGRGNRGWHDASKSVWTE